MTRTQAFIGVALASLGVWSAHNYFLLPLEAAHFSERILPLVLLAAKVVVWFGPVAWYVDHFHLDAKQALALVPPGPMRGTLVGMIPAVLFIGAMLMLVLRPERLTLANLSIASMLTLSLGVVGEELLMRGFFFGEFCRYMAGGWAVVATAALFASVHVPAWLGFGTPVEEIIPSLAVVFTLGSVLGFARLKSASLWPPVLIHFVNNLLAILAGR